MAFNIFKKGNYIILIDADDNYIESHSSDVLITKAKTTDSVYNIRLNRDSILYKGVAIADIKKENGDSYTQEEFETFYTENTGNPSLQYSQDNPIPVENLTPSKVDTNNSTSTPLSANATFTGTATDVSAYGAVVFSMKTDQAGTLYGEFSTDGINWDSSLPYELYSGINEVHRLKVSKQFFRIRVENGSTPQTYMRVQTLLNGNDGMLTSALNSPVYDDADTLIVRPMDFNLMVAEGLYYDRTNTIKDGYTPAMGNGNITQDLWTEAGAYTGFPLTAAAAELVVAGADTGTVFYSYMATDTDLDYTFGSKAITGAGTYSLGHNIWRCNFMYFVSNSATGFNAGKMTIRHTSTPANIFVTIDTGRSQSFCAAYTVPYQSAVFIDRWQGAIRGSASGSADGFVWYRDYNSSPRFRFPFELQFGSLYFDDVDYLIKIHSRTDFIPRIINTSANSLTAKFQFRLIKVK